MASVLTSRGITDEQGRRHNLSVKPECKVIAMSKTCRSFQISAAHVVIEFAESLVTLPKKRGKDAPDLMFSLDYRTRASIRIPLMDVEKETWLTLSTSRAQTEGNIVRSKLPTELQAYRCRIKTHAANRPIVSNARGVLQV